MRLLDEHLQVEVQTKGCDIPPDERARLQVPLGELAQAVQDIPDPALWVNVMYHPHSELFHAEFKLKLPGWTIVTGEKDSYLDNVLERGMRKLIRRAEAYKDHPDRDALAAAARLDALDTEVVAPEDPDAGPLAEAVERGDYRAFRTALVLYEDWLRNRAGRWIQRRPEAQARLGRDLHLGDVVEEIYLNAFEQFTRRPTVVRLGEWLEEFIDPSISALLRYPDEEEEAASLARTLRERPLE